MDTPEHDAAAATIRPDAAGRGEARSDAAARATAAAAVAAARLTAPAAPSRLRPVPAAGPERRAPVAPALPPAAAAPPAGDAVDLPRFAFPVSSALKPQRGGEAALLTGLTPEVNGILREAFTPTRPKKQLNSLFVGRNATLKRIISAVEEERAHVILFGDRGRGKTSLSNAIEQIAAQAGYLAIKMTCSGELTFEDIFRHVLKRIPSTYYRSGSDSPFASRRTFNSFAELLPEGTFSVTELNDVLETIQNTHVLLILDEYDRVTDEDFRNKLAELFKNLTDSSIPMTLMVVGVAENLDQLLGKHPSIQRSLVPVHLPLMSDEEIERLIHAGAENAGLSFAADAVRRIADFARGLPYYAQLLGLHSARSAFSRGARDVGREDLAYAVSRCLQEAERGIVESYNRALAGRRRDTLEDVLHAAALCPADAYGAFDPADMTGPDGAAPGRDVAELLERLTGDDHGAVLVAMPEPGRIRYRFRNQMARQYVLMRIAEERGAI
ncbi:ATP-binding protein [Azospirillum halopraeferens]|uniref:ATP-binding protein n=1 Tax=Azospirillum halopraeferens TaxID=34010 RepID=UPI0004087226|nr:ATP-binding protein [Azospirillum halopraeferens]